MIMLKCSQHHDKENIVEMNLSIISNLHTETHLDARYYWENKSGVYKLEHLRIARLQYVEARLIDLMHSKESVLTCALIARQLNNEYREEGLMVDSKCAKIGGKIETLVVKLGGNGEGEFITASGVGSIVRRFEFRGVKVIAFTRRRINKVITRIITPLVMVSEMENLDD